MKNSSFLLYLSTAEDLHDLTDEECGQLFRAVFDYAAEKKQPHLSPLVMMAFRHIRQYMDANEEKYREKCKKNRRAAMAMLSQAGGDAAVQTDDGKNERPLTDVHLSESESGSVNESEFDSDSVSDPAHDPAHDSDSDTDTCAAAGRMSVSVGTDDLFRTEQEHDGEDADPERTAMSDGCIGEPAAVGDGQSSIGKGGTAEQAVSQSRADGDGIVRDAAASAPGMSVSGASSAGSRQSRSRSESEQKKIGKESSASDDAVFSAQESEQMNAGGSPEQVHSHMNGKERRTKERIHPSAAPAPFAIPDREEVIAYCREHHLYTDADRFFRINEANGWCTGGQPIRDWRALLRGWSKQDGEDRARTASDPRRTRKSRYGGSGAGGSQTGTAAAADAGDKNRPLTPEELHEQEINEWVAIAMNRPFDRF